MRRLSLLLGLLLVAAFAWLFWPRTGPAAQDAEPAAQPAEPSQVAGSLERGEVVKLDAPSEAPDAGAPFLPAGSGLTIRVEDLAAAPLENALVWLADERGVARPQGRTGSDGRLVVMVQEWAAMAGARQEGFAPAQQTLVSKLPGSEVLLRLTPAVRISGQVTDWNYRAVGGVRVLAAPANQPVSDGAVLAVMQTETEIAGPFALAISAADGSFVIENPCPGHPLRLFAGGAGYASETWDGGGYRLDDVKSVGIMVSRLYGARWLLSAPGATADGEAGAVAALRQDLALKLSWSGNYGEKPLEHLDPSLILAGVPAAFAPSEEAPLFIRYSLAKKTESRVRGQNLEFGLPGRGAQTAALDLFPLPDGVPPLHVIQLGNESAAQGEVVVRWNGSAAVADSQALRPPAGWGWIEFEPADDATRNLAGGTLQAPVGDFPLRTIRVNGIPHGMYRVRFVTLNKFVSPGPEEAELRVVVGSQPSTIQIDLYGMGILRIVPICEDGTPYAGPARLSITLRNQLFQSGPYLVPGLPAGRVWCGFAPWHGNTALAGWADVVAGTVSDWQVRVPLPKTVEEPR